MQHICLRVIFKGRCKLNFQVLGREGFAWAQDLFKSKLSNFPQHHQGELSVKTKKGREGEKISLSLVISDSLSLTVSFSLPLALCFSLPLFLSLYLVQKQTVKLPAATRGSLE